jgi:hypothetical protein
MINHHKIQTELMEAVTKSREVRVHARKQVEAVMCGAYLGNLSIKDAFREHALATAAHNRATKEFRDYHLNGRVPSRLEHITARIHDQFFGSKLAELAEKDIPVAA